MMKIGFEFHQRLDTKRKLFSHSLNKENEAETGRLTRRLRAVAGEEGNTDETALHEARRGREFEYVMYEENTGLVEADEEPPIGMDEEALEMCLQICKLLDCKTVDEVHIMRKTVIDGSNTSGFQRTAVIGMNGRIAMGKVASGDVSSGGKIVGIATVVLEEEAARILEKDEKKSIYKLNGLGVPLVEITTEAADMGPEEAKALAEKVGLLLRSCKVQRGIGTIRQDINISVPGGSRVEIKGFQNLREMEAAIRNEERRQKALLQIKEELNDRKFPKGDGDKSSGDGSSKFPKGNISLRRPAVDVTQIFSGTKNKVIKKELDSGGKVLALLAAGFSGYMKRDIGGKTLARELADWIKPAGVKGFIHSDEDMVKYELEEEMRSVRRGFKAEEGDVVIVIAGKEDRMSHGGFAFSDKSLGDVSSAAAALAERINMLAAGVPEETRRAEGETSAYMRPLAGSSRMYPETDIPPVKLEAKRIAGVKAPRTLEDKEKELKKEMPEELARQLVKSRYYPLFDEVTTTVWNVSPVFVATTLLSTMKDLKRKGVETDRITREKLKQIFELAGKGTIPKGSVADVLTDAAKGLKIEGIMEKYRKLSGKELEKKVKEIVTENKDKPEKVLMGIIMSRLKADGSKVAGILRKESRKKE